MQKETRQVRRLNERAVAKATKRSARPRTMSIIGWVALAAVLAIVAVLVWQHSQGPESPAPHSPSPVLEAPTPADLFAELPPGFQRITTDEDDPIAYKVRDFFNGYAEWLAKTPLRGVELQREVNATLGKLMADLRTVDPKRFATTKYRRASGVTDLAALSNLFNNHLFSKGWAVSFGVGPAGPNKEMLIIGSVGRCRAVKRGTTTDFKNRRVAYVVYLVDYESEVGRKNVQAETRGNTIQVYSERALITAREAREIFRELPTTAPYTPADMPWHVIRELQDDYNRLGDTDAFEQFVAHQLYLDTMVHELQHVRDAELQQATNRDDLSPLGMVQLRAYGEARGALAEIANGQMPLMEQGILGCIWTGLGPECQGAAQIARRVMGSDLDPQTVSADELRRRAKRGLAILDADYDALVRHAGDPNPVKAMRAERTNKGR